MAQIMETEWVSRSAHDLTFQIVEIIAGSNKKITFSNVPELAIWKIQWKPDGQIHFGLPEQTC